MSSAALGPVLGSGREADVYAHGAAGVLKLYRPGFGGHRAEAAALRSLEGHGIAPKLVGIVDRDGRTGLVVERVPGFDMLAQLQRRPWQVLAAARSLAQAHLAVHRVTAAGDIADLRQALSARIRDAALPQPLLGYVLGVLDGLPDGDRLCHGDFHPGNVLRAEGRTAVIDWSSAARGVPEADHARTLMLLRWADPLPDTPAVSRAVIAAGRRLLTATYARAYRHGSPPLRHIRSWLVVHMAARLGEDIPAERAVLLARLERARNGAA
ncbi:phosphotransferase [Catellatospora sp. NPDC049609]|uniref:phosphotransferase family protein n=1 Tax=Catellatospora sp. NPDC049609 TaxID=3155505 RepID=UPI00342C9066